MLRNWRKLVRTVGQVKSLLSHQWNNHMSLPWSHAPRLRLLKYCTLLLIAGYGVQKWLLPLGSAKGNTNSSPNQCSTEGKKRKGVKHHAQLWWSRNRNPANYSHRGTFRDITIREYENRLRMHSQPEKIFGYFATIKMLNCAGEWEVFMTPVDFLRSMMPGIRQPEGLGLNKYRKMTKEQVLNRGFVSVPKDSIFYKLRPDGLITFTDYLFLHQLVPMPDRYFEIGFRLFDPNGSDNLGLEGMNQLLHGVTGNERFKANNSINHFFFGPKLDGKLSLSAFLKFKRQLIQDSLLIEFNLLHGSDWPRKKHDPARISEFAFSNLLLAYSRMPRSQKVATLRRIKNKYRKIGGGVTLEEFMSFFKFVQHIPTIDMALTFHFLAGADISRATLKHIADIVVGVKLSPNMIDIIYTVFDTDDNGILGRTEFLQAMRQCVGRKRRIKIADLFDMLYKCASRTLI